MFPMLLVPLSERRHRLYSIEVPEVKEGLKLRLHQLYETRKDKEAAEIVFRALFRLSRDEPGRPKYPEFSWDMVGHYLDILSV